MVEVQTWAPLKNTMMGLHYWSPIVCFHLRVVAPPKSKSNWVSLNVSKANPWPNLASFVLTTYIVQLVQMKWLLNGHAHVNLSLLLNPILRSHTPILSKCVELVNMPLVFFFFFVTIILGINTNTFISPFNKLLPFSFSFQCVSMFGFLYSWPISIHVCLVNLMYVCMFVCLVNFFYLYLVCLFLLCV
jgi:hypothetical protein